MRVGQGVAWRTSGDRDGACRLAAGDDAGSLTQAAARGGEQGMQCRSAQAARPRQEDLPGPAPGHPPPCRCSRTLRQEEGGARRQAQAGEERQEGQGRGRAKRGQERGRRCAADGTPHARAGAGVPCPSLKPQAPFLTLLDRLEDLLVVVLGVQALRGRDGQGRRGRGTRQNRGPLVDQSSRWGCSPSSKLAAATRLRPCPPARW